MNRFANQIVVVTGAAGGIGTATCQRFAQEGADIVALDLPTADFSTLSATTTALGRRILCIEMNVSAAADWQRAIAQVEQTWGGLDVLVNNAGIAGPLGRFADCTLEDFERTLAVNVRGVFLGMQAVLRPLRERGGGAIVNVSSVSGSRGNPRILPYVAAKHAVNGMTKSAALDLIEYGIRVNAVCPSPTNTNMMKAAEDRLIQRNIAPAEARKALSAGIPLGRYGEPHEIAAVIAFLCSPDASFITGAIMNVDGGMLAY
jgi:NAD(P)-dependent dehydrogenase (short-subunit alcohol dehydrogenase family)